MQKHFLTLQNQMKMLEQDREALLQRQVESKHQLRDVKESQHREFQELKQQCVLFEKEKNQLLQVQEELQLQCKQLRELVENPHPLKQEKYHAEKLPYESGNKRELEAMYIQLKDQFQEKCDVLDKTRRELFHVSEKLLHIQRESEEERLFDQSLEVKQLLVHIAQLGSQFEQVQSLYQAEMDEMTQLVSRLFQQIKSYKKV